MAVAYTLVAGGGPSSRPAEPAPATHKDLVVSVVVPVRDQAARVGDWIRAARGVLDAAFANHELVLVDDGSTDGTAAAVRGLAARDMNIRLIFLSRRYGHEVALTAGLDAAIGDFVVCLGRDLQDPPGLISRLVARAREGGLDVVYVRRPPDPAEPWPRRLASRLFFRISRGLSGLDIREDATGARVLSRRAVNALARLKEHNRVMWLLLAHLGFATDAIEAGPAEAGSPASRPLSLRERYHLALDAVIASSDKPLRYVSGVALLISAMALLGAVAVVLERLVNRDVVAGWASLMVVQLGMFCLLFLLLAIVSEYVSRILTETKNRPSTTSARRPAGRGSTSRTLSISASRARVAATLAAAGHGLDRRPAARPA
jgi:dolichol-phosphate mannosyltransferase